MTINQSHAALGQPLPSSITLDPPALVACNCGLPASLYHKLDDVPFEALVWMSRMCRVRRGLCCVRTAALTKVFE